MSNYPFWRKKEADNIHKYYVTSGVVCDVCHKIIRSLGLLIIDWRVRVPSEKHYIHKDCAGKVVRIGNLQEYFVFLVVDKVPVNSVPVIFTKPSALVDSSSGLTVFDAADINDCKVVDRTVHANRNDFELLEIGKPDVSLLRGLDKPLGTLEGLEVLDNIMLDSKRQITSDEKKLLEDKRK